MFSALKNDSIIYILEKNDTPRLTVASVTKVSSPYAKIPGSYLQTDMLIDVEALGGGTGYSFKKLPASLDRYEEGGAFVTDDRNVMLSEVTSLQTNSKSILDSEEYHQRAYKAYGDMMPVLNPEIAEEREREKRMQTLEKSVTEMRGVLDNILSIVKKQK